MGALDDKLVWLDEFNKNIIDYDKVHYCVLWLLAVRFWQTSTRIFCVCIRPQYFGVVGIQSNASDALHRSAPNWR